MKMVTVSQAKSRLSSYIKSAESGEDVVIMRGSKPAVILRPVSEADLSVVPEISLAAAKRIEQEVERERKAGKLIKVGDTPQEAVSNLKRLARSR